MLVDSSNVIALLFIILAISAIPGLLRLGFWLDWHHLHLQTRELTGEPRCASCGHIVHFGSTGICCECGADLHGTGIVNPLMPQPRPPIAAILVVALVAVPLSLHIAYPVAARSDYGWKAEYPLTFTTGLDWYELTAYGTGRGRHTCFTDAHFRSSRANGMNSILLFHHPGLPYPRPPSRRRNPSWAFPADWHRISEAEVLDHRAFTRERESTATQAIARQLCSDLHRIASNDVPASAIQYSMTGQYLIDPENCRSLAFFFPWYTPYCLPLWLAITGASTWLLLKRHRRRLAHFNNLQSAILSHRTMIVPSAPLALTSPP